MKIKDKPRFYLGVTNCILGIICAVTLLLGRGGELTGIAMVACLLTGIGSIIDSMEER